jgi:glycosyltransferase involved in cell wall biosynthesis
MTLPTFSIVIETANLSMAELDGLMGTLESMAAQSVPIQSAAEVLLVDTGDVPEDVMQRLLKDYPWVRLMRLPATVGYEELKMAGADASTGDVVIFADGDCYYEPQWLDAMLTPFADASVDVVGGATEIDPSGPFGLGSAIAFSFPARSPSAGAYKTDKYHLNNVAFRRSLLQRFPIPSRRPCYRMAALHAAILRGSGYTIWRQPAAGARHAAPNGFSHFMWRFLMFGHDGIVVPRLVAAEGLALALPPEPSQRTLNLLKRWVAQSTAKLAAELRRRPLRIVSLPLVLGVVVAAAGFQAVGALAGLVASKRLLEAMPKDMLRASTCQPDALALPPVARETQAGKV